MARSGRPHQSKAAVFSVIQTNGMRSKGPRMTERNGCWRPVSYQLENIWDHLRSNRTFWRSETEDLPVALWKSSRSLLQRSGYRSLSSSGFFNVTPGCAMCCISFPTATFWPSWFPPVFAIMLRPTFPLPCQHSASDDLAAEIPIFTIPVSVKKMLSYSAAVKLTFSSLRI